MSSAQVEGIPEQRLDPGKAVLAMRQGRTLTVQATSEQAVVTIASATGATELSFEIRLDATGPVVSVKGSSIEVEAARRVGIRCDEFLVEAREKVELVSGGTFVQRSAEATRIDAKSLAIDAKLGGIRVSANDDVQLLGESILLNCDRPSAVPSWVADGLPPSPDAVPRLLPAETVSGDASLVDEIDLKP
jgi:hypothetical protein